MALKASSLSLRRFKSHVSYGECGLGSDGTDRLVALVRLHMMAARAAGQEPLLYGAKITGGGSGGGHSPLYQNGPIGAGFRQREDC